MISPEAEDLVDSLVGALSIAGRARGVVERAAAAPHDESLPEADAELVLVMLGIVTMARRFESALGAWQPEPAVGDRSAPSAVSSMRDLLR